MGASLELVSSVSNSNLDYSFSLLSGATEATNEFKFSLSVGGSDPLYVKYSFGVYSLGEYSQMIHMSHYKAKLRGSREL